MNKGLTLPNRQWDRYTDAEMAALWDLQPDTIVWLLYGNPIDVVHATQLAPYIASRHPRILYRPYRDDIPLQQPEAWARQCAQWISMTGYQGELIPANEMNLAVEHGSEDWAAQIAWLKAFAFQWRKLRPDKLHLPALSPSGNYLKGWASYENAKLFDLFDVADIHIYSGNEDDYLHFPLFTNYDGPISITEFNGLDPSNMTRFAETCRDAVWFLLGGTPDQAAYDILTQPSYYASFKAMRNTPSTPATGGHHMIPGIDVSNHQGTIDWPLVARCGPQFAVIKATESTDYLDPYFAANWQKARDAGLVRGAYGFGRPSRGSGKADATYFLSAVKDIQQGDFLVLDLEDEKVAPTADLLAYTLDWLRTVEAAVGFKPLLYSGHYYLAPHNCEGHAELAAYGLWLASYQSTLPPVPKGWDWFAMWQYSDRGVVPGIGACDVDLFNGSLEQLKKYGKP